MLLEGGVLAVQPLKLAFDAGEVVIVLDTALQGALAVLQQSSLLLGQVLACDAFLDLYELPGDRILRLLPSMI